MWSEYLQNTSSESKIRDYVKKAQNEAGFLYFYFLSADGNYKMVTGCLLYTSYSHWYWHGPAFFVIFKQECGHIFLVHRVMQAYNKIEFFT